jgi:hypothetical protein
VDAQVGESLAGAVAKGSHFHSVEYAPHSALTAVSVLRLKTVKGRADHVNIVPDLPPLDLAVAVAGIMRRLRSTETPSISFCKKSAQLAVLSLKPCIFLLQFSNLSKRRGYGCDLVCVESRH